MGVSFSEVVGIERERCGRRGVGCCLAFGAEDDGFERVERGCWRLRGVLVLSLGLRVRARAIRGMYEGCAAVSSLEEGAEWAG